MGKLEMNCVSASTLVQIFGTLFLTKHPPVIATGYLLEAGVLGYNYRAKVGHAFNLFPWANGTIELIDMTPKPRVRSDWLRILNSRSNWLQLPKFLKGLGKDGKFEKGRPRKSRLRNPNDKNIRLYMNDVQNLIIGALGFLSERYTIDKPIDRLYELLSSPNSKGLNTQVIPDLQKEPFSFASILYLSLGFEQYRKIIEEIASKRFRDCLDDQEKQMVQNARILVILLNKMRATIDEELANLEK